MRANWVKQLWREGKAVSVGWQSTPDPFVAETMAHVGFDALVLDMQHGMGIGPDRAAQWLQVVSTTDSAGDGHSDSARSASLTPRIEKSTRSRRSTGAVW